MLQGGDGGKSSELRGDTKENRAGKARSPGIMEGRGRVPEIPAEHLCDSGRALGRTEM